MGVAQETGAGEEPAKIDTTRPVRAEPRSVSTNAERQLETQVISTLPRNERSSGKNARQGNHAQQVAVEKPPRIAGSPPQPFQVPTLHPMGCTHLCPRDEIQPGTNADKRHIEQDALGVIGKQLLLGCAKGDETEIGS